MRVDRGGKLIDPQSEANRQCSFAHQVRRAFDQGVDADHMPILPVIDHAQASEGIRTDLRSRINLVVVFRVNSTDRRNTS